MHNPISILHEYWGYDSFRKPQEEIVNSVLNNQDTIALLPTGGGKSVCFQVPALAKEGICIVISPLVALIQDQVENLKKKGIKTIGLTGGLKYNEVDNLLDNCVYGNYKFLYLSPERLQQELVQERIKQMPVNLIAIDEAHCISQWGNDFRPAYRNCALLRELLPDVPLIALTASATAKVVKDISENLKLVNPQVFRKSFARPNIAYMVFEEEDKRYKLELILKKNKGSSIVYVTSRKATVDISRFLNGNGFTSEFFHGGISTEEKNEKLEKWISNKVQVMVATNAFGMGIDKPDVRTVIHLNLSDSIENYYQEAGRAGRDGLKSFAIILKNKSDELQAEEQFVNVIPDPVFLKQLYNKLNNYFQVGFGEGENESFSLHFNKFCHTYKFNSHLAYNGLKALDRHSVINFIENYKNKTSIRFIVDNHTLFSYLDKNPKTETIVQAILRTYGGIFDILTKVNTTLIAKKTMAGEKEIFSVLKQLEKDNIIELSAQNTDAEITFLVPREDDRTINVISKDVKDHLKLKVQKVGEFISYTNNNNQCKSVQILNYFGETDVKDCGICSYCIEKKKELVSDEVLDIVCEEIIKHLKKNAASSRKLHETLTFKEDFLLMALKRLLEDDKIYINDKNEYQLN